MQPWLAEETIKNIKGVFTPVLFGSIESPFVADLLGTCDYSNRKTYLLVYYIC